MGVWIPPGEGAILGVGMLAVDIFKKAMQPFIKILGSLCYFLVSSLNSNEQNLHGWFLLAVFCIFWAFGCFVIKDYWSIVFRSLHMHIKSAV